MLSSSDSEVEKETNYVVHRTCRCSNCGAITEEYSEDEVGHCIVVLGAFINREPALAAPLLPEVLLTVSKIARSSQWNWEMDSQTYVPGNSKSVARQNLRSVFTPHYSVIAQASLFLPYPGVSCIS
jgi:hypothetical protein